MINLVCVNQDGNLELWSFENDCGVYSWFIQSRDNVITVVTPSNPPEFFNREVISEL